MITVVLDHGHGIETKGKRSPDGLFLEYKWCRDFTKILSQKLKENGIPYYILVPELTDITLQERVKRLKNFYKKDPNHTILISVHNNAAGNGSSWMDASGWEVWTSRGKNNSDTLATCIYDRISAVNGIRMRQDFRDGDPDKESDFYILKNSPCPAVLTENMFQDNYDDVRFLDSEEGKEKLAEGHIRGIIDFAKQMHWL